MTDSQARMQRIATIVSGLLLDWTTHYPENMEEVGIAVDRAEAINFEIERRDSMRQQEAASRLKGEKT